MNTFHVDFADPSEDENARSWNVCASLADGRIHIHSARQAGLQIGGKAFAARLSPSSLRALERAIGRRALELVLDTPCSFQ